LDAPNRNRLISELSAEIAVVCTRSGVVAWADERATSHFGSIEGKHLRALAIPGTEQKVDDVVARACTEPVARAELAFVHRGKPITFSFSSKPLGEDAVLVGRLVNDNEIASFGQMSVAMTELAELQREAERNRKELAKNYKDLDRAHSELVDSNRALVTMHGVLDDKNDALRRASDIKSRVVANVSHEFRTPINSILGLTQILLDKLDGDLTSEQQKQVRFIRSSAESLSELVNDLLDLSRIEAGRYDLRASEFGVTDLFSSLRGMMKPLVRTGVELVIEDPPASLSPLSTDSGKVAQVLRNLVANAIKFTREGKIVVRAVPSGKDRVRFEVSDTGVGIAPENHERIFDEFVQIEGPHQRSVQGTGLGLAVSRRLAEILGGTLSVRSRLGEGATFVLDIPIVHEEVATVTSMAEKAATIDTSKRQILVVEDNRQTLFFYERYLTGAGFQVVPARTVEDARKQLERVRPAAIVLDVMLEGEVTWGFLADLKENPDTHDIPVMIVTVVDRAQKARALGADEFWLKPVDGDRLIRKLAELSRRGPIGRVLVIDDDETARYMIRKILSGAPYTVFEAADGASGVALARSQHPDVIFLDFLLTNETAFDVIDDLKADASTRNIPIIIQTAKTLDEAERQKLERETASILKKQSLSREVAITRIREALESAGIKAESPRTT
jgi:signal transduction histidine kinase/DNA-binding response OmpR family regulator